MASSGRPRCTRWSRVPLPAGVRSISTVLVPGGICSLPSQPHVNTTRRPGTTSTNLPATMSLLFANSTRILPPGRGSSSASLPFHRTYCTGSVRRRKTVSGEAAIVISRSMTLVSTAMPCPPLLFLLRGGLQRAKAVVPERLESGAELRQGLGARAVEAPRAIAPFCHEARLLQDAQVLRYRRPADVEAAGDLPDRQLRKAYQPKDFAPPRLSQRRKRVHGRSVSVCLRMCQIQPPSSLATDSRPNQDPTGSSPRTSLAGALCGKPSVGSCR